MPISLHFPKGRSPNFDLKLIGRCLVSTWARPLNALASTSTFALWLSFVPPIGGDSTDGAGLVAGRKQNPPGGPRISAPPSRVPGRSHASRRDHRALRHLSEFPDLFDICRSFGPALQAMARNEPASSAAMRARSVLLIRIGALFAIPPAIGSPG